MTLLRFRHLLFAPLLAFLTLPAMAQSAYENSPYYEEEPWYDITEWFDGNDYRRVNPDESQDSNDSDTYANDLQYDYGYHYGPYGVLDYGTHYDYAYDNDLFYGYDNRFANDNWFYDYWEDGYTYYRDWDSNGLYEYATSYQDFDGDGYYDAYLSYYDWDRDGFYEDIDYFSFNKTGQDNQDSQQQANRQSKQRQMQGKVAKTKKVSVRDTKHLVVQLDANEGDNQLVDLGPTDKWSDFDVQEGTKLQVSGPLVKVGDKKIVVARSAKIDGESVELDRSQQRIEGEVASTRQFENRGTKHVLATINLNGDKQVLVDLGPAERLEMELNKNSQVTIKGAPVVVNDRRLLIAHKVMHDGDTATIDRSKKSADSNQQTKSQQANNKSSKRQKSMPWYRGEVAKTMTTSVRGNQRQIAMIKSKQGKSLLVDLGPANEFDADLAQGDQVAVCGPMVKATDGRPVVLARMMKRDSNKSRLRNPSGQQLQQVSGDIQSLETVKVRGQEHQLAHLQTKNGQKLFVDLGPTDDTPIEVNQGEQLTAKGRFVKANDKLILVAFEASEGDNESQSIRSMKRQGNRK